MAMRVLVGNWRVKLKNYQIIRTITIGPDIVRI